MIKYLVMGLKKLLTRNYCEECNKILPVLYWKLCDDCDYKSFRNTHLRKQIRIEQSKLHARKNRKQTQNEITAENILHASILLTDDVTGEIIGYKM